MMMEHRISAVPVITPDHLGSARPIRLPRSWWLGSKSVDKTEGNLAKIMTTPDLG